MVRELLLDRKRKSLAEGDSRKHEGEGWYHGWRAGDSDLPTVTFRRPVRGAQRNPPRRLPTGKVPALCFCHIHRALRGMWPCPKCPLRRSVHTKMSSIPGQISSRPKRPQRRAVHAEGPNTLTGAFDRTRHCLAGRFGQDQMSTNPRETCPRIAAAPTM